MACRACLRSRIRLRSSDLFARFDYSPARDIAIRKRGHLKARLSVYEIRSAVEFSCPNEETAEPQKRIDGCRNSTPARVVPSSVRIKRATRHARSSFVSRLVRISFWEGTTAAETGNKPPCELT